MHIMNASQSMLLVLLSSVIFNGCLAGIFSQKKEYEKCSYPTWKCDCKLFYNCDTANTGFPDTDLGASPADELKDLAPYNYPLQMPGKRWRRNVHNQREFCQKECFRRMNAFLCLDESGDDTAYSRAAVCTKLQERRLVATDPAADEPCCEVFLQWGPQWCDDKWYKSIFAVSCQGVLAGLPGGTVLVTHRECDAGDTTGADTWCPNTVPMCN